MQSGQERKYSGDEVLTRLEDGKYSLLDVLELHEKMNVQQEKRSHGLKVAVWACGICFFVLSLALIAGVLHSSRQNDPAKTFSFIIPFVLGMLLFFAATLLFCKFCYIDKPQRQHRKALTKGYPGLDPQSKESIQGYIWAFESDHQKLVAALCSWMEWKCRCARKVHPDMDRQRILSPQEMVLLDAIEASSIESFGWVYDWYGEAIDEYVWESESALRQIKAFRAADIWQEALPVMKRISGVDDDIVSGILADLEMQLIDCRNDTIELAYQYVMLHKMAFI